MRRLMPEFWYQLTSKMPQPLRLIALTYDNYRVFPPVICNFLLVMG
jgi:hypothetical protein